MMNKEEYLKIIDQGVEAWNVFAVGSNDPLSTGMSKVEGVELHNCNFEGKDLSAYNFTGIDFTARAPARVTSEEE